MLNPAASVSASDQESLALVAYDPSKDSSYLAKLFSEYESIKVEISNMARASRANGSALDYFYRGAEGSSMIFKDLFDERAAIGALNSDFWTRLIEVTDVLQCMPASERNKWSDTIREHKTPEFNEENVKNTVSSLLMQRSLFLAQKVDGIFYKLSGKHVTNDPVGFGQRMIFGGIMDYFGYINHGPAEYIDDLRSVINKLLGRTQNDKERYSYGDLREIVKENGFGQWYRFDGGALKIKLFKKGTVHISVHPEIAYLLNGVLAEINGSVISSKSKSKIKFSPDFDKNDVLSNEIISRDVISYLRTAHERLMRNPIFYISSDVSKGIKKELISVLEFLGGIEDKNSWTFDYDVAPILSYVIRMGTLPERKSYQFYPTKPDLAKTLVKAAGIKPSDRVLEPSAGQGGIALFIKSKNLVCLEINKMNCKILDQKGLNVIEHNFLTWETHARFDKIVMNPPFHFNQAADHVEKAFDLLTEEGEIHAILPASYTNKQFHNKWDCSCEFSEVIEDAFDGTGVRVVMLKLKKLKK